MWFDWFEGFGCCILGDLCELLCSGLWWCCGLVLVDMFDVVYGNGYESFMWFIVLLCFDVLLELLGCIDNVEGVLVVLE